MSRPVTGTMASVYKINRICYRGGSCNNESGGGVWALVLLDDVSGGNWANGFCLKEY